MNADPRSTTVFPEGIARQDGKSLQETNEALATMPAGMGPSLVGVLTTSTARFDGLCADQSPEDLSDGQVASFTETDPGLDDRCSDALRRVSSAYDVLPKSYLLTDEIISLQAFPPRLSKKPSHDFFAPLPRHHRISINDRPMAYLHSIEQKWRTL